MTTDDADRRAEELVTSNAFMAAAHDIDTIAMEKLIADAFREYRNAFKLWYSTRTSADLPDTTWE